MNNYNEFDTCEIYARKEKVDQIKNCYQSFAWKVVEEKENEHYSDTIDITFQRPHKIKHKDELQLMQVYMEDHLNKIGTIERSKHSKSLIMGISFGLLGLAIMVLGLLVLTNHVFFNIIIGSCLVGFGLIFCVIIAFVVSKVYKTEIETFETNLKQINSELADICAKAKKLAGDK